MRKCAVCNVLFINIGREICCSIKCKLIDGHKKESNGCWIWNKGTTGIYGKLKYKLKTYSAHRASFLEFKGSILTGKIVCHTCDNPKCINPDHLFIGTQKQNINDAINKGRFKQFGELNNFCKYTDITIEEIIKSKLSGNSYKQVSEIFNCSKSYIYYLVNKKFRRKITNGISS